MTTPQQPELARSRRSEADPAAAKARTGGPTTAEGATGPVPEDNQPGHHPEEEQDKPKARAVRRPRGVPAATTRKPKGSDAATAAAGAPTHRQRFAFSFEPTVAPLSFAFGVTPLTAWVEVTADELFVRFGPWSLRTPLDNVEGAEVTGPYSWPKVAGPAHISLKDRGLTFATSTRRGLCVRFRAPVTGALPLGLIRHPAVTLTVEQPEELAARLLSRD